MSGELYDLALTVPWCITTEALEAMLSIAARDPLPQDEIARRMHLSQALAFRSGKRREDSRRMTMDGPVAVIPIDGPIYRYADIFTAASGGVTTEALARDFRAALDDPAVSAVLFAIDSPGGEVDGISELADAIYAARGVKPIVAYVEGYGASAAYWIASAADRIIAGDTALIGSIGTVMGVPDPAKRVSRSIDFVASQSPKKRADPTTDEGRAYYQRLTDATTDVFIAKVARNRRLDRDAVLAIEGAMLLGAEAVTAGLADALGSEDGAIRALQSGALPMLPAAPAVPSFPRSSGSRAAQEDSRMKISEMFGGFLKAAQDAGIAIEPDVPPAVQATAAPAIAAAQGADDERAAAVAAENAELRKQLAQARAERIQSDAQAFVKEQLGAGHAFPAEQQALLALYVRAAEIDATAPRDDGQPSTVALVKAAYASRPASTMARSVVDGRPGKQATVLTNTSGAEDPFSPEASAERTRAYAERANGKRA